MELLLLLAVPGWLMAFRGAVLQADDTSGVWGHYQGKDGQWHATLAETSALIEREGVRAEAALKQMTKGAVDIIVPRVKDR